MSKKLLVVGVLPAAMMNLTNGESLEPFRPTVMTRDSWLQNAISQKKVELCIDRELPAEATDKEFKEIFFSKKVIDGAKGDDKKRVELAIDAFKKKYPAESKDDESTGEKSTDEESNTETTNSDSSVKK